MRKRESFLSPLEVADFLGFSVEAVRDLVDKGELEIEEMNGVERIRLSEVEKWLDRRTSPENLLELVSGMKESPDPEKIADALGMDVEKVKKVMEEGD